FIHLQFEFGQDILTEEQNDQMKIYSIFFYIIFSLSIEFGSIQAQENGCLSSLDMLVEEALQNNPEIKSAEWLWRAYLQRPTQVSALPDPMFSYSRFGANVETRVGPQENVLTLSQKIPFPGKLSLKGKMANQDALAAEQKYQATVRDVIYKLKLAYYDLYWVDQSLLILQEYQQLLRDFQRVAETKYATGTGIQANVLKAQVEISSILERQLNFDKIREGAVARLNALLAQDQNTSVGFVGPIDTTLFEVSEAELIVKAIEEREELNSAKAMIQKSEYAISLSKRNYWPDLNLSFTYITIPSGRTVAPDNGKDAWSINAGINLPIWQGRRNAAVDEAQAMLVSNRDSYENLKNEVQAEIKDLLARLNTAERTVNLYAQQLIPDAGRTLQSVLASYQTGTLDFLNLLDSERMLLNFRLAYAKELANYRQQMVGLERAVGGELP
ncbi:MAG: TolC family protein, partial [Calditrichaeota bacterium]|nr:TolC family protein [Calditrichota bacterium]